MHDLAERIYLWLCRKAKGSTAGKVRSRLVIAKLCADILNDPAAIRKALLALRADGRVQYSAGSQGEPVSGFVMVTQAADEIPGYVQMWNDVVMNSRYSEQDKRALAPIGKSLDGFTQSEMGVLLNGLSKLRDEQGTIHGQLAFNASAAHLMGSSKLLSSLDSKALRAFGIMLDRFRLRPLYVVVGGNTRSPKSIILVENPIPFETALASEARRDCLFVCTFGFGLSAAGNDYGNQLAGAVEADSVYVLNRSEGVPPDFKQLLGHSNIQFWGDLDTAGMQIFGRLRAQLPHIELSALYAPMIEAIKHEETRHPYVAVVGKNGQAGMPFNGVGADVQALLTLCRACAVDQEIVTADQIGRLAGQPLDRLFFNSTQHQTTGNAYIDTN